MKKRVGVVFGTRPDAIKMAPVVMELLYDSEQFQMRATRARIAV